MVPFAKPSNVQGLGIIFMMSLHLSFPANLARLLN
jgi:hypothetical protein